MECYLCGHMLKGREVRRAGERHFRRRVRGRHASSVFASTAGDVNFWLSEMSSTQAASKRISFLLGPETHAQPSETPWGDRDVKSQ